MGGLIAATILTLTFLPALYAAWFRVRPPQGPRIRQSPQLAAPVSRISVLEPAK
jgi:hypothetical protein